MPKRVLQPLHRFARDPIEPSRSDQGYEMDPQDRLLRCDPARPLSVRPRLPFEETRRELFERWYLLFRFGAAVLQHMPLTILAPSLGNRLRLRNDSTFPEPRAIRHSYANINFPTTI